MKKIIYSILFGALILFAPIAIAAEGGIQISPLTYNFDLKPGETKSASVNITNQNAVDLNYVMEVELFTNVTKEGAPSFAGKKPEGVTTLADWFVFAEGDKEGIIAPSVTKEVNFTITVPQGAEPGGHYAAVFAKEVKKNAEGQTQLGVSSRVGTLVLVSVPGEMSKTAEFMNFIYNKLVWKGPISFLVNLKNTGTVHYDSPVKVEIKPLFGATKTVDLGSHTIIPKNAREYKGNWDNKYPFGYYSLKAIAQDGNQKEMINQGSIIALPLIIILPLIAIIIITWLIIRYVKKNFKITAKANKTE